MGNETRNDLVALDELSDFRVAEGNPDVRGWRVIAQEGVIGGKVNQLIVDQKALKVRYLDVQLNKDLFDRKVDRRILIPIGLAFLDTESSRVLLENTVISDLLKLPPYAPGPITRDYEMSVREALATSEGDGLHDPDMGFYEHDHFNADRFYGRPEDAAAERHEKSHLARR